MIASEDQCKTEFERVSRLRRLSEPIRFGHVRWEALDRFLSVGFPTTRDEAWAFTSVAPISEQIFTVGAEPAPGSDHVARAPFQLPGIFGAELVFVNGYYVPDASATGGLPEGVRVEPLSGVLHANTDDLDSYLARIAPFEQRPFVALNTALFMDGACIRIPAHTAVTRPIHLRFISTGEADLRPAMSHPRVLILLDEASEATIVESYTGQDGVEYFTNVVTEIVLGEHAVLDHYTLQHESCSAYHINATYVIAARDASYSAHSIGLGGALVRHDVAAVLAGERAQCAITTLSLADRQRLMHTHTSVDHAAPHCTSAQISNGILAGDAVGVSDSTIAVREDAQESAAKQTNRTFLLSRHARIHSTPHLEILASGVDCAQRAFVRHLDAAGRRPLLALVSRMLQRLRLDPLRTCVQDVIRLHLERM